MVLFIIKENTFICIIFTLILTQISRTKNSQSIEIDKLSSTNLKKYNKILREFKYIEVEKNKNFINSGQVQTKYEKRILINTGKKYNKFK